MSRIFLSHSSTNNAEAIAVRDWMVQHGWNDAFLDLDPERGLRAGERWQDALKRAAERCEMVIFLISPVWAASKWCLAEFLLAKSLNKRIFALIVEQTPYSALPVELTAEWQVVDLTAGARDYTATVTLPPGDKTATVAFGSDGLNRLRIGLMQAGIDAKHFVWPPAHGPNRPPFRGLKPLEEDDAGIFFGRVAPVISALDQLRGLREAAPPRLFVVLGASGSGKSSFLRAGLLPHLKRDDRNFWVLPIIRPEQAAITGDTGLLHALEGAFQTAKLSVTRADLRVAIDAGATRLRPLLQTLAEKVMSPVLDAASPAHPPTLILPVDQGEELFLAEAQEEAGRFLQLLRDLLADDAPPLAAVFTIRSDNYERLQLAKPLEGLRQVPLSLPPMPKGSYAEIIEGPARRLEGTARALKIEASLVQELLADIEAGGAKDALPLLAFTLERLYSEYHAGGHLKLEHYNQLGGVKGSIEAAVEGAFKAADADPKIPTDRQTRFALLRRGLIPWLAGIDLDTGVPRRRVARTSEIPAEARPLVDLLIDQRLLSTDVAKDTSETTIEPAHEALLRQWSLLQGWLVEDAGLLSLLDGLKRASRDWISTGKDAAWLVHGTERLIAVERLFDRPDLSASLQPTDIEYLAACREVDNKRQEISDIEKERYLQIKLVTRDMIEKELSILLSDEPRNNRDPIRYLWESRVDLLRSLIGQQNNWHPKQAEHLETYPYHEPFKFPCCGKYVEDFSSQGITPPNQFRSDGCREIPKAIQHHESGGYDPYHLHLVAAAGARPRRRHPLLGLGLFSLLLAVGLAALVVSNPLSIGEIVQRLLLLLQ